MAEPGLGSPDLLNSSFWASHASMEGSLLPISYQTACTQKASYILRIPGLWNIGTPGILNEQGPCRWVHCPLPLHFDMMGTSNKACEMYAWSTSSTLVPHFLTEHSQLGPLGGSTLLPYRQGNPSKYLKLNWSGCLESNFISSNYFSLPNLFLYVSSDKLDVTSSKLWCLSSSMPSQITPAEYWTRRKMF